MHHMISIRLLPGSKPGPEPKPKPKPKEPLDAVVALDSLSAQAHGFAVVCACDTATPEKRRHARYARAGTKIATAAGTASLAAEAAWLDFRFRDDREGVAGRKRGGWYSRQVFAGMGSVLLGAQAAFTASTASTEPGCMPRFCTSTGFHCRRLLAWRTAVPVSDSDSDSNPLLLDPKKKKSRRSELARSLGRLMEEIATAVDTCAEATDNTLQNARDAVLDSACPDKYKYFRLAKQVQLASHVAMAVASVATATADALYWLHPALSREASRASTKAMRASSDAMSVFLKMASELAEKKVCLLASQNPDPKTHFGKLQLRHAKERHKHIEEWRTKIKELAGRMPATYIYSYSDDKTPRCSPTRPQVLAMYAAGAVHNALSRVDAMVERPDADKTDGSPDGDNINPITLCAKMKPIRL